MKTMNSRVLKKFINNLPSDISNIIVKDINDLSKHQRLMKELLKKEKVKCDYFIYHNVPVVLIYGKKTNFICHFKEEIRIVQQY